MPDTAVEEAGGKEITDRDLLHAGEALLFNICRGPIADGMAADGLLRNCGISSGILRIRKTDISSGTFGQFYGIENALGKIRRSISSIGKLIQIGIGLLRVLRESVLREDAPEILIAVESVTTDHSAGRYTAKGL